MTEIKTIAELKKVENFEELDRQLENLKNHDLIKNSYDAQLVFNIIATKIGELKAGLRERIRDLEFDCEKENAKMKLERVLELRRVLGDEK